MTQLRFICGLSVFVILLSVLVVATNGKSQNFLQVKRSQDRQLSLYLGYALIFSSAKCNNPVFN